MVYLRLATIYLGIGIISGIISGISTELKPLGLIIPGPVFGVSFACASMLAEKPLKWSWLFVCFSGFAFVASDIAFVISFAFADEITGGRALSGAICGFVGASILAIYSGIEQPFNWLLFFVVPVSGCLLGALTMPVVIQLRDTGSVAEPLGFTLLFTSWQAGTMLSLGLSRHSASVQ